MFLPYCRRDFRIPLRALSIVLLLSLVSPNVLSPIACGESANVHLFITPSMYIARGLGELFTVAINVSDVENLHSVGFTVTYNSSLLNVVQVTQGNFFPSAPASHFEYERNVPLGFVRGNISLVGSKTQRSGHGTIARVDFEVIQVLESCAISPLSLQQTLLLDSALRPIAHDSVGAIYFWQSVYPDPPIEGRSLDVRTQRGGTGSGMFGGVFMVGEEVRLTSLVTYNNVSVQQKLVAFEVKNPLNESVLFREATTDQDGLAEIAFRIPDFATSLGTWRAISVVEIAEKVVWDTISFAVYSTLPVGGYSFAEKEYTSEKPLTVYLTLVAILTTIFTTIKRRTHRKFGIRSCAGTFLILIMLFSISSISKPFKVSGQTDTVITDFYSCDALGIPQDYFPRKTTAYFNVSITNLAQEPKNVSIHLTVQDELSVPIGSDQLNTTILPGISMYYIMSIFVPKWAYVGIATGYVSVWVGQSPTDGESTQFYVGPEDLTLPVVHVLSPGNVTYEAESVPLVFTVNERTTWIGYRLNDHGNVTVAGNATLTSLVNGPHSLLVYASDTSGNVGFSEVHFNVLIIHDVAIIDLFCSSAEVYLGQVVNITILVQNEGNVPETFNATIYANITAIEIIPFANLFPRNQTAFSFLWDTTGFAKGNYTISARIAPVPSEIDIMDNTHVAGVINIMLPPDIAVTNVTASRTSVGQGYPISINVTVENQGDYTENLNITVCCNATTIQTEIVTLASGDSTTVTFVWNTSGFARGNYTLSAHVDPIPHEVDMSDNFFSCGWVFVTIPGDVSGVVPLVPDGVVDMRDIGAICDRFSTSVGDPRYCPDCDINNDGVINMRDIVAVCTNFGK